MAEPLSATDVVVSTAVELVCRLYVATHVARGDFEQLPEQVDDVVADDAARPLLLRYFGADFSPGMSLPALSLARGWMTVTELADGVAGRSTPARSRSRTARRLPQRSSRACSRTTRAWE